jgi:chromatin remodeling complex protein RSC6
MSKPLVRISASLSRIIGTSETTRQQALKRLWDYVKANQLQNPVSKREIICDESLAEVFRKPKVTMFEVALFAYIL